MGKFSNEGHMRNIIFLVAVILVLNSSGCSVGMAMSGKEDPNLGMVRVGATRGEIELTMGPPIKTVSLENGNRMDVYEYQIGNKPSAGRAVGHAVMDLLTLTLWEIVGTPIEANMGDKHNLNVTYDKTDKAIAINSTAVQPQEVTKTTETEEDF